MTIFALFTAAAIFALQWSAVDAISQVIRIGGIYPITDVVTAKINRAGAQWLAASLMAAADLNTMYAKSSNYRFKLAVRDSRKTFSNTVVGCLALSKSVFNSNGSHVIVGAGKRLECSVLLCYHQKVLLTSLPARSLRDCAASHLKKRVYDLLYFLDISAYSYYLFS
jgi:hypothetical protein